MGDAAQNVRFWVLGVSAGLIRETSPVRAVCAASWLPCDISFPDGRQRAASAVWLSQPSGWRECWESGRSGGIEEPFAVGHE
jgi:hypothetical protein